MKLISVASYRNNRASTDKITTLTWANLFRMIPIDNVSVSKIA